MPQWLQSYLIPLCMASMCSFKLCCWVNCWLQWLQENLKPLCVSLCFLKLHGKVNLWLQISHSYWASPWTYIWVMIWAFLLAVYSHLSQAYLLIFSCLDLVCWLTEYFHFDLKSQNSQKYCLALFSIPCLVFLSSLSGCGTPSETILSLKLEISVCLRSLTVWEYLSYHEFIHMWSEFILNWYDFIPIWNEFILECDNFLDNYEP